MADYWKSQPRKFCDFCKCWITDNKPSVDFHEKGKKHKENVQKRIDEVKKKQGIKDKKAKEMSDDMRAMEEAALKAFKQDLIKNPALAAQYGVRLPDAKKAEEKEELVTYGPEPEPESSKEAARNKDKTESDSHGIVEWFEAKSPEGYTYYWNTATGESKWIAPEKYISLAEQEGPAATESRSSHTQSSEEEPKTSEVTTEEGDKEDAPSIPDIPLPISDIPLPGVVVEKKPEVKREERKPQHSAYGSWSQVQEEEEEEYQELDLPTVKSKEVVEVMVAPLDVPKFKFKEKRVSSLAPSHLKSDTNVAFKKRKFNSGARQMRKRGEDM